MSSGIRVIGPVAVFPRSVLHWSVSKHPSTPPPRMVTTTCLVNRQEELPTYPDNWLKLGKLGYIL